MAIDVDGRPLLLLGAGREARAAARALAERVARPIHVCDDAPQHARALAEENTGVAFLAAEAVPELIASAGARLLVLRAPGVRPDHPVLAHAAAAGAASTTFSGLWLAENRDRVIATVTGTKGKSTTTALMAAILRAGGRPCVAAGNIGAVPPDGGEVVMELSSYQLHDAPAAARVHVLTNLFREHLDWHGEEAAYHAAKCRPFAIDPACVGVIAAPQADLRARFANRFVMVEDVVAPDLDGWRVVGPRGAVRLEGARLAPHLDGGAFDRNLAAALAAIVAADALPLEALPHAVATALAGWTALPSRRRLIGTFAARRWVDDALATIPEATLEALGQFAGEPVRLIMGGRDRGQDFTAFGRALSGRSEVAVYAYGPVANKLASALDGEVHLAPDFDGCLEAAFAASAPGDVMLFSPAAATHEPGQSYEHRQRRFAAFARAAGAAA